jgi:hypothetical protein
MMPKSATRFSDDVVLQHAGIDHEFGSSRSKSIVSGRRDAVPKVAGLSHHFVILWHAG